MGSTSGFLTTIARLAEPGLLDTIATRLSRLLRRKSSLGLTLSEVLSPGVQNQVSGREPVLTINDPLSQNTQHFACTLLISLHIVLLRMFTPVGKEKGMLYTLSESDLQDPELAAFIQTHSNHYTVPRFRSTVKEYASSEFAAIRKREGVSDEALARSLDPESNWLQTLEQQSTSGGRSGSFFLKTYDNSLLLKTITRNEKRNLLSRLVPRLFSHPRTSILARIHGLFAVKLTGTEVEYVVVMDNVLQTATDISETYDLKGSKLNREVLTVSEPFMPSKTLKDVDFHKRKRRLTLSPADTDRLTDAILADVSLLAALRLMDYSLLVAIGEFPGRIEELPLYLSRHLFRVKGSEDEVYIIGIIDYLETYSLKKKMETASKSLVAKRRDISSMRADRYSERFLDMVGCILA